MPHQKKEMALLSPADNLHLKSECFVASYVQPVTHRITNQELFEILLCNQSSNYENTDDFRCEGKPSCATAKLTLFTVRITNQELFEKLLCNQSSNYENTDDFRCEGKPSRATAKLTLYCQYG